MSLRDALGQSINIVAVKLFYLVGLGDALKVAENMGISTLTDVGRYGLTLVIGGGEATLLDMTSAYGVFANNGIRNPYTGILKIEDLDGKILEEFKLNEKEVLPKNTALTISDILSDNTARIPTFGANSLLRISGKDVAAKTGTTNNNRDAWTVGYTPSIAVGVWAGNNDNKPMKKGGVAMAGPIWNKYMNEALKVIPSDKFEKPNYDYDAKQIKPVLKGFWQGNESFFIDKISGKLATEFTPRETIEEKVITNVHSILYWIDKKDILGPAPTNPSNDSQFNHWEIPIQNWWSQNSYKYKTITSADKPVLTDDVHTVYSQPVISIIEPNPNKVYTANQRIYLNISNTGYFPINKMDIFINDVYVGTTSNQSFSFIPQELDNLRSQNDIKIISYDTVYNRAEVSSTFEVSP
jgi:membrane peptidoglycan carboxypeptidase